MYKKKYTMSNSNTTINMKTSAALQLNSCNNGFETWQKLSFAHKAFMQCYSKYFSTAFQWHNTTNIKGYECCRYSQK